MMSYADPKKDNKPGRVDGALRWIGDLDHPFYSDERNRYVWYEASAIAFQLLFIGSYISMGAVLWVAGADAMPYALALFVPTMISAAVFQGYLKRNSAEYWPSRNDLVRRRGQFGVLAGVFLLTGLIRAAMDVEASSDGAGSSFFGGLAEGTVVGLLVGPLAAIAFFAYKRREGDRADNEDDF